MYDQWALTALPDLLSVRLTFQGLEMEGRHKPSLSTVPQGWHMVKHPRWGPGMPTALCDPVTPRRRDRRPGQQPGWEALSH